MLPEDAKTFLAFVQEHDRVVITYRDGDSPSVEPIPEPTSESGAMTLWNRDLTERLVRKKIVYPGREYYRVDDSLPVLEFSPSRTREWNGQAALLQGRIYGFFDKANEGYERWYNSLAQWIRANFEKCPVELLGGYIGPAASKWFQGGGVLLPMLAPPITPEWLAVVKRQHEQASPRRRRPSRAAKG